MSSVTINISSSRKVTMSCNHGQKSCIVSEIPEEVTFKVKAVSYYSKTVNAYIFTLSYESKPKDSITYERFTCKKESLDDATFGQDNMMMVCRKGQVVFNESPYKYEYNLYTNELVLYFQKSNEKDE